MKRRAIVFGILTSLLLCFIWGQSMLPRDVSAEESSRLMLWLKPLLDPGGHIEDGSFHHYLRKAAHFTEYAALGFCMCGFLKNLPRRHGKRPLPMAVIFCIAAAAVDECIQFFSAERGPKIADVLLDSVGSLFGIFMLLLFAALHRHRKEGL